MPPNISFRIEFHNRGLVIIETDYTEEGLERQRCLTTVFMLIVEYKNLDRSPAREYFAGDLYLYLPNSKEPLDCNLLLTALPDNTILTIEPNETRFIEEQNFTTSDFSIGENIGEGSCQVSLAKCKRLDPLSVNLLPEQKFALKICDNAKQQHLRYRLRNEMHIYDILKDLQGILIPKFYFYGYYESICYVIGIEYCGEVPKMLTIDQKCQFVAIIDRIHEMGIIHNDIRKENLLVDKDGKCVMIDFGHSDSEVSDEKFAQEKVYLLYCLSQIEEY